MKKILIFILIGLIVILLLIILINIFANNNKITNVQKNNLSASTIGNICNNQEIININQEIKAICDERNNILKCCSVK